MNSNYSKYDQKIHQEVILGLPMQYCMDGSVTFGFRKICLKYFDAALLPSIIS
jgi:hypothetical protein